jgi:hypothetical protein
MSTMPRSTEDPRKGQPPAQPKVKNLTPTGSGGKTQKIKLATRDPPEAPMKPLAVEPSRPNFDGAGSWSVPLTPTSLRREAAQAKEQVQKLPPARS